MNEGIFTLELGRYGIMLDTDWCYIALSWELLVTGLAIFAGIKIYNKIKNKKKETPLVIEDNDDWLTNIGDK
jgi:hypothetical protein